jgi:hypothetical protein
VKSEKTKAASMLAVLLIYLLMAGSTSGGFVLCIGTDGHMALEPAFHERCDHLPHGHQEGVRQLARETTSHAEDPHCNPCIDIPLSMGLTGDKLPPNQVKVNSQALISFLGQGAICDNALIPMTAPPRFHSVAPPSELLRTVILLV